MDKFSIDALKMLYVIYQKPKIYLGSKSLSCLKLFLDGFAAGYSFPNVESFLPSFQDYISNKYNCILSISWSSILLYNSGENEEMAFDLFFEELESYFSTNGINISEIKSGH